ncbi:MAG: RNase adapter RapZ [Acidimicrobiales bacterium]
MQELIVIAGQSGAGRSHAADALEDLGWFVIDNLPPSLIPKVVELAAAPGSSADHVVLVVGTERYRDEVLPALNHLREDPEVRVRVVFLEARSRVLVMRYESTRRRHPFDAGVSLQEAIDAERVALESVRAEADVIVDTSDLNVHELRARMVETFGENSPRQSMQIRVSSFGYKQGIPLDVDVVLDCRFLPNPYWVDGLRDLTGQDAPVREYVLGRDVTRDFLDRLGSMLELLVPAYEAEGKSYLTVAFGCTGGRHRSVCIAEEVAQMLRNLGHDPQIAHRDLDH